jgi:hypothetical protein
MKGVRTSIGIKKGSGVPHTDLGLLEVMDLPLVLESAA